MICQRILFGKLALVLTSLGCSDDSWHVFMKRFAASVVHITGQELEVKAASESASSTLVEQELESLRTKYEELSDEVCDMLDVLISTC